jgi:hypothetical protein
VSVNQPSLAFAQMEWGGLSTAADAVVTVTRQEMQLKPGFNNGNQLVSIVWPVWSPLGTPMKAHVNLFADNNEFGGPGTNYVETLRVQIHANCRIRWGP